jgi:hypothetical protein
MKTNAELLKAFDVILENIETDHGILQFEYEDDVWGPSTVTIPREFVADIIWLKGVLESIKRKVKYPPVSRKRCCH